MKFLILSLFVLAVQLASAQNTYFPVQYYGLSSCDPSSAFKIVVNTTTSCSKSCQSQGDVYVNTVCSSKSISVPAGTWAQQVSYSSSDCKGNTTSIVLSKQGVCLRNPDWSAGYVKADSTTVTYYNCGVALNCYQSCSIQNWYFIGNCYNGYRYFPYQSSGSINLAKLQP